MAEGSDTAVHRTVKIGPIGTKDGLPVPHLQAYHHLAGWIVRPPGSMNSRGLHLLLAAAAVVHVAGGDAPCLTYHMSQWGWGSNVNGVLLTMAAHTASSIILHERGWAYKCSEEGSWREFFAGPSPMTPAEAPNSSACEPVEYQHCAHCGHNMLASRSVEETMPLMLGALRRLWQLSTSVALLADIQAAWLASLPKPLIGIHIRAGDKHSEDKRAGRDPHWYRKQGWVQGLQELLSSNGLSLDQGGTCLMYGDDLPALSDAAVALHKSLTCTTMLMGGTLQGHHQMEFNSLNRTAICDSTRSLILSVEALAKTDLFIGSFVSNIPRLVHLLRILHGKAATTSRDVNKEPVKWHHNYLSISPDVYS